MKTLSCKGLTDKDQLVLRSLVDLMISRTSDDWTYSEEGESDVVIVDTDNLSDPRNVIDEIEARNGVAIEYSNSNTSDTSRLRIQKPLRAANLISVFNSVESRLTRGEIPNTNNTGNTAGDTAGILDLISAGKATLLRVSSRDSSCVIDLSSCRYSIRGSLSLAELLVSPEKAITTLAPEEPQGHEDDWQPMPSLQWLVGMKLSGGELIGNLHAGSRFKLHHWPPADLAKLEPQAMTLSAILSRKSGATIDEVVAKSGIPDSDIIRFINGAYLAKAISIRAVSTDTEDDTPNRPEPPSKGLFDMIRNRLTRKPR
ncbi:MAG: hypothetical protein EP339_13565 [Gammaproteobacteria bacterium]|nr:MAG: hypothetical protein EP339_13565 [Gammaproteobacteria bacterium]